MASTDPTAKPLDASQIHSLVIVPKHSTAANLLLVCAEDMSSAHTNCTCRKQGISTYKLRHKQNSRTCHPLRVCLSNILFAIFLTLRVVVIFLSGSLRAVFIDSIYSNLSSKHKSLAVQFETVITKENKIIKLLQVTLLYQ